MQRTRGILTPARIHVTSRWQGRPHEEFICRLRDKWPHRSLLGDRIADRLRGCGYDVREATMEEASQALAFYLPGEP